MESGPITSWQIDGETMETVRDYMSVDPFYNEVAVFFISGLSVFLLYSRYLIVFLLLSCKSSFYVLDICPLPSMYFAKIFLPVCTFSLFYLFLIEG